MTTIGDVVSRLRNVVKAVKADAFLTDRFLYSVTLKYAKMVIRRQDNENKIKNIRSLFETLPCLDLEETSKIEACCSGVTTDCTIMRTKDKLPAIIEGTNGPLIRGVSTVDNSVYFNPTTPQLFISIANSNNYQYNKAKYYWIIDNRLYFPNVIYDAVNVEAMWEDSIDMYKCDTEKCKLRQDDLCAVPDYLFAEIEQMVLKELGMMVQMPTDNVDDKQSVLRS